MKLYIFLEIFWDYSEDRLRLNSPEPSVGERQEINNWYLIDIVILAQSSIRLEALTIIFIGNSFYWNVNVNQLHCCLVEFSPVLMCILEQDWKQQIFLFIQYPPYLLFLRHLSMIFSELGKGHSDTFSAESSFLTLISQLWILLGIRWQVAGVSEAESSLPRPACMEEAAVYSGRNVCLSWTAVAEWIINLSENSVTNCPFGLGAGLKNSYKWSPTVPQLWIFSPSSTQRGI